jgi:hypothetical protein
MGPVSSIIPYNCDNSSSTNIWWEAGDACPFIYNCAIPPADCNTTECCVGGGCTGMSGNQAGYGLCGACNTATANPTPYCSPDVCDQPWGSPYCCAPIASCPSCVDLTYSCEGVTCTANCSGGSCATSTDGTYSQCCYDSEPCPGTSYANCCDWSSEYCDGEGDCIPYPDD